ncbi:MAG: ABC transporter permease [Candidatus Thorarchaeota archaeon]|nr:ABC transporter permease [Candidatus Thorarchaeota archaeon]
MTSEPALDAEEPKQETEVPPKRKLGSMTLRDFLFKAFLPALVLILLWQVISIPSRVTLIDIAEGFVKLVVEGDSDNRILLFHSALSIMRVLLGFLAAAMTGIPLGIAIGRYKAVDSILGPVVDAMRPIPPIAWIPLALIVFTGNLLGAQIFVIWVGAFFPILIDTTTGVKRTEPVHIDVAKTFGASESEILAKVVVPSAAPEMFSGLRIGFGIGWMCLMAAEMIGGGLGLGYLIWDGWQIGRTAEVIATMLVVGVIGFIFSYGFLRVERRLLKWRQAVSV